MTIEALRKQLMARQMAIREAKEAIERSEEGRVADARVDGGEFSGPANGRAFERTIAEIAERHGLSDDELFDALMYDGDVR